MDIRDSEIKEKYASQLDSLIQKAKNQPEILAVSLYGSFVKETKFRDIDVCIFIFPVIYNNFDKLHFVTTFMGDFPEIFDIHIYQDLPLYIQERVLNDGKILFNRDFDTLFDIYEKTHKDYDLFIPHFRHYLGEA